jgi:nitroreductase
MPTEDRTAANPVLALMSAHRTIRRFLPEPVDDATVRAAVAAAQHASTSSHIQGYTLIRVRDTEQRRRLVELTGGQPQVAGAGAFFVVCGDVRRHRLVAERAGRRNVQNLETFLLAAIDASLFAQNLALAFESLGLGVCMIGGLRNHLGQADELLGLPAGVLPFFGLCVGRPDRSHPLGDPGERPRLPVDAVLLEGGYPDDATMLALVDEHDRETGAYYAARGKPGYTWSGGIARRFLEPHRAHLFAFYESKGARLE